MTVPADIRVPAILIPVLAHIVHQLVVGNYASLEATGLSGRLTAEMLREAVEAYPYTLVDLPDGAWQFASAIPIRDQDSCWAVDVDLWTAEEGRSDLTLQVRVQSTPDGVYARITNLHVM